MVRAGDGAAADAAFDVYSPRNGFIQPVMKVSAAAVARGLGNGWLKCGPDERLRISAAGLQRLREAKTRASLSRPARSPSRAQERRRRHVPFVPEARIGSLAWLRRRKDKDGRPLLSEAQFAAGERLSADFWRGRLSPRVTADWSINAPRQRVRRSAPGPGIHISDSILVARERVRRALAAVGPELGDILVDVCCRDLGLEVAERARCWPAGTARIVLGKALTALARHYGIIAPPPVITRMLHWEEDGYRPDLKVWAEQRSVVDPEPHADAAGQVPGPRGNPPNRPRSRNEPRGGPPGASRLSQD
ncbi:MAG TPA: DUF6456 domain-containing protein [Hyphomicrobiaceae bacterium]|nr:DUF6456 domain-containing protein [Hyphomicrobiaceae bacterium]